MTTWMDLEGIMLSEKSLIKKDKYTISISGVEKQKTQQSTSSQARRRNWWFLEAGGASQVMLVIKNPLANVGEYERCGLDP